MTSYVRKAYKAALQSQLPRTSNITGAMGSAVAVGGGSALAGSYFTSQYRESTMGSSDITIGQMASSQFLSGNFPMAGRSPIGVDISQGVGGVISGAGKAAYGAVTGNASMVGLGMNQANNAYATTDPLSLAYTGASLGAGAVGAVAGNRLLRPGKAATNLPNTNMFGYTAGQKKTNLAKGLANRVLHKAGGSKALLGVGTLASAGAAMYMLNRGVSRLAQTVLSHGTPSSGVAINQFSPKTRRRRGTTTGSRVARYGGMSGNTVLNLRKTGGRGGVRT